MALVDLTGTKWVFNDYIPADALINFGGSPILSGSEYTISLISNETSYKSILAKKKASTGEEYLLGYKYPDDLTRSAYSVKASATSGEWGSGDGYKTIEITGGTDATNTSLIAWLEAHATQIIDPPTGLYRFLDDSGLSHVFTKLKAKFEQLLNGKANKVPSATQYNVALFDENGDLYDGGVSMSDRATMRGWKDSETSWGTYIEQDQGGANMKSFGFMNSSAQNLLAWQMYADGSSVNKLIPTKEYLGDLAALTTDDKTSLVSALNEVYEKSGEPFRVKNWSANNLNVVIPYCTEDIENTSIAKMDFVIDAEEGAAYQVVGMVAYEVKGTDGKRINCWPVCQFTGNGQKTLSVRWMCGGTVRKTAAAINAWVLLKHR